jgi:hypothetical protein
MSQPFRLDCSNVHIPRAVALGYIVPAFKAEEKHYEMMVNRNFVTAAESSSKPHPI